MIQSPSPMPIRRILLLIVVLRDDGSAHSESCRCRGARETFHFDRVRALLRQCRSPIHASVLGGIACRGLNESRLIASTVFGDTRCWNRLFPTKAFAGWLHASEEQRVAICAEYRRRSGDGTARSGQNPRPRSCGAREIRCTPCELDARGRFGRSCDSTPPPPAPRSA